MKARHLVLGAIALAIVVGFASAVRYLTAPREAAVAVFPEKLELRVLLPGEHTGESNRTARFASDGFTPSGLEVEYQDGSFGEATFYPTGVVSTFTKFHPQEKGGAIALTGQYAEDGIRLLWDKQFTSEGVIMRQGERLASGDYSVKSFASDGLELASHRIFNGEGVAYSDFALHESGALAKLVMETEEKGVETTLFNRMGVKTSYHSVKYNSWTRVSYAEDGSTPIRSFDHKSDGQAGDSTRYIIEAVYYNPDGSVNHERRFSRDSMFVTLRDDTGEIVFIQYWRHKTPGDRVDSLAPDQWVLDTVYTDELIQGGGETFYFHRNGNLRRHFFHVSFAGQKKNSSKSWHEDGSGSLVEYRYPHPDTGKEVIDYFEAGERVEPFDSPERLSVLVQLLDYVEPPELPHVTVHHNEQ